MFTAVFRPTEVPGRPVLQRARGQIKAAFRRADDGTTRATQLFQEGCLKLRMPRAQRERDADLAIINLAGGLTGGDRLSIDVSVGEGACVTVTTPACERIYRSIQGEAVITQILRLGRGARLDWLPQEAILFDQSRLWRRLEIELEEHAEITVCEAVLFGRTEMGETVSRGLFSDFWTVRRSGELLFAEATRMAEPFDRTIAYPSSLGGNTTMASLLHVGDGLAQKRDALRSGFGRIAEAVAAASIVKDVLVARIVGRSGYALRQALLPALAVLRSSRPLPRLWSC